MKVRHRKGLANHPGPESCGGVREGAVEALTGETAGWVLSREMLNVRGADAVEKSGRQHGAHRHGEVHVGPARSETPRTPGHHPHGIRHLPVPEQGRWLGQVMRGYFAYHAMPTNARKITSFHHYVVWHGRRALSRRSQKAAVSWSRMARIVARWLPPAQIRHPWPQLRFLVKHPRWEPSALVAHARICPGGAG